MPGAPLSNSPLPGNHASQANPPFWYSFDYGSVHFVILSTEHDITPGSQQHKVTLLLFATSKRDLQSAGYLGKACS